MGELVRLLVEIVTLVWPFRTVDEWERGGYYVCGRWWREVGPGVKLVVPWFCDVITVSMVPAIIGTGRQDITLSDGSTLSFSATAQVRVTDVKLALNSVDQYQESAQELLSSVLAAELADVAVERMNPERRSRLFKTLENAVQKEAEAFGLEFSKIRFTSFVQNVRTYRLLMDQSMAVGW